MDWGFKHEEAWGHVHELTGGFKDEIMLGGKFESINALAISLALAGNFGFNFGIEIQHSLINLIINNSLIVKKHKLEVAGKETEARRIDFIELIF